MRGGQGILGEIREIGRVELRALTRSFSLERATRGVGGAARGEPWRDPAPRGDPPSSFRFALLGGVPGCASLGDMPVDPVEPPLSVAATTSAADGTLAPPGGALGGGGKLRGGGLPFGVPGTFVLRAGVTVGGGAACGEGGPGGGGSGGGGGAGDSGAGSSAAPSDFSPERKELP